MTRLAHLALAYAAGSVGGAVTAVVIWLVGILGVTAVAGVAIAPSLTPAWLYSRIVWGGLWGFLLLIALPDRWSWWQRGLLFSLGPTLVTWFVVFPLKAQVGVLGLDLGSLTPLFVVVFNGVWGLTTAAAMTLAEPGWIGRRRGPAPGPTGDAGVS